jgi:hypothetical protein
MSQVVATYRIMFANAVGYRSKSALSSTSRLAMVSLRTNGLNRSSNGQIFDPVVWRMESGRGQAPRLAASSYNAATLAGCKGIRRRQPECVCISCVPFVSGYSRNSTVLETGGKSCEFVQPQVKHHLFAEHQLDIFTECEWRRVRASQFLYPLIVISLYELFKSRQLFCQYCSKKESHCFSSTKGSG